MKANTYRKNAIIVGVLFIACTAATLLSFPFSGPILDDASYLTRLADNETLVIIGALVEFVWAATAAGIAIGLYPILRKQNRGLALGAVGFRVVEGVFVLVAALGLLSLLTLSQEFVKAGAPETSSFQTMGTLLLSVRDWAHNFIASIAFCLGALVYYYLLYQSRLVPRWLSGWGILGVVLSLVAVLLSAFNHSSTGFASIDTILNAPIGVNEMVLALWLIIKGFNRSAVASLSARTDASQGPDGVSRKWEVLESAGQEG